MAHKTEDTAAQFGKFPVLTPKFYKFRTFYDIPSAGYDSPYPTEVLGLARHTSTTVHLLLDMSSWICFVL